MKVPGALQPWVPILLSSVLLVAVSHFLLDTICCVEIIKPQGLETIDIVLKRLQ